MWIVEGSSGVADLKRRAGTAGADDVGDHMSAGVDVDADVAAAADSKSSASADAGAAGETILRCPWRPRGSAAAGAVAARAVVVG